ncbi:DMT family transporter [Litorisediminicola beolgyonensis]|uniref:DMT family transporter n=1 Tax=Litorisediminicola beolgyonensis TaxID=1173614 RepID=A0ABW3ZFA1_9RHOB
MENLRGILLMVVAMGAFAIEDTFIKTLAPAVPVGQILLIIGVVSGGSFAAYAHLRGARLLGPALWSKPVLWRTLCEIVGTISFMTAITTIPLATASAIAQAMPLVITLGAALFFGEEVGWRRWSAIGVGLAGVLIILRPGTAEFDPNTLWAVVAVFALAARDLCVRAVPAEIGHLQVAAYGLLSAIPSGLLLMPFTGGPVAQNATQTLLLAGAVVAGGLAYYALTSASRTGQVSVVTPFRFSRILFALILGAVFFGERPDLWTLLGATLIVGSGIFTLLRERRAARIAVSKHRYR